MTPALSRLRERGNREAAGEGFPAQPKSCPDRQPKLASLRNQALLCFQNSTYFSIHVQGPEPQLLRQERSRPREGGQFTNTAPYCRAAHVGRGYYAKNDRYYSYINCESNWRSVKIRIPCL